MSDNRTIDVLAIGGADIDIVFTVPKLPSFDEKVLGKLVGRLPGGAVANFACAASRLGLRVSSFTVIGDDENGRDVIKGFEEFGVDTSLVRVAEGKETPFTVIFVDPTGEKAIVVVQLFEPEYPLDIAAGVLPQTCALYMMPKPEQQFLALAQLAHQHSTEVMIDVEPTTCAQRDHLERILRHTDIACFNKDGFMAAAKDDISVTAARRLLDFGPHTIVVTRGKNGALVVTRDDAAEHSGFSIPQVIDTTGAGDTFNAAFLQATLRGQSLTQRLRFANAAAALSVTALGPRGFLPSVAEVEAFLERST